MLSDLDAVEHIFKVYSRSGCSDFLKNMCSDRMRGQSMLLEDVILYFMEYDTV